MTRDDLLLLKNIYLGTLHTVIFSCSQFLDTQSQFWCGLAFSKFYI